MKSCNIEFNAAADKTPIDQIISEQLITGLYYFLFLVQYLSTSNNSIELL